MGIDRRRAQEDFNMRIDNYTKIYDPMSTELDGNASFIKLIDVGRRETLYIIKYNCNKIFNSKA